MGEQSFRAAFSCSHAAALLRTGLNPCPRRTEPRALSLPSHGRMIAIPAARLLGVPSLSSGHGSLFLHVSQCEPELVTRAGCLRSLQLRDAFTRLPDSFPSPLPHCPSAGVREPSEARGCRQPHEVASVHAVSLALAWLWAGWWRCCKRASECVCEVEVYASLWDLPSNPASCAFPSQQGTWLCFFFSLLPCVFFCFLSCSPSLFPSLSLFLCFFFFLFFFQKIKARKGEGSKEKAQERPVQTTQLVRLCPLLVDSLPSLSPTSPPACCSLKITPSPPVTGGLQVLQGQCWRWHRSGTKGVSGKVALACSTLSNLHW